MKVISVIENEQVIEKILKHLGLCEVKARPPPKVNVYPPLEVPTPNAQHIDYSDSQLPPSEEYLYVDEDYPLEDYAS